MILMCHLTFLGTTVHGLACAPVLRAWDPCIASRSSALAQRDQSSVHRLRGVSLSFSSARPLNDLSASIAETTHVFRSKVAAVPGGASESDFVPRIPRKCPSSQTVGCAHRFLHQRHGNNPSPILTQMRHNACHNQCVFCKWPRRVVTHAKKKKNQAVASPRRTSDASGRRRPAPWRRGSAYCCFALV